MRESGVSYPRPRDKTKTHLRLLTPLYAIHPPHVLAVSSIHLTTRLLRIPLPEDWYILFDTTIDDLTSCAGTIMSLYYDWGVKPPSGLESGAVEKWNQDRKAREDRWRRSWILAQSRKNVRKWVERH